MSFLQRIFKRATAPDKIKKTIKKLGNRLLRFPVYVCIDVVDKHWCPLFTTKQQAQQCCLSYIEVKTPRDLQELSYELVGNGVGFFVKNPTPQMTSEQAELLSTYEIAGITLH